MVGPLGAEVYLWASVLPARGKGGGGGSKKVPPPLKAGETVEGKGGKQPLEKNPGIGLPMRPTKYPSLR